MAREQSFDWLSTDAAETILWSGGPRVRTVAGQAIVAAVVVVAVAVYEPLYGVGALVLAAALVGWSYLSLVHTDYVLTDHAVYRKQGILGERVSRVALSRIQNTDLKKSVVGAVVGYGNIEIDTAGSSGVEIVIGKIEHPEDVRELLLERTKQAGGGGVAGGGRGASSESVERALAESRALRETAEALERTFVEGRP